MNKELVINDFSSARLCINPNWNAIILDINLDIQYLHPDFAKLVKAYPDTLLGKNISFLNPKSMPATKQLFASKGFNDVNFEFYNNSDEYVHLILNGFCIESDKELFAVIFWNDITKYSTFEKKYLTKEIQLNTLIYKISHDLRGPIASTKGLLNLIKVEATDNRLTEYLNLADEAIAKLDGRITELSKVADLASSGQYYFSEVDMHSLIYKTISDLSKNYDVYDIVFDFKLPADLIFKTYEFALVSIISHLFIYSIENKNHNEKLLLNLGVTLENNKLTIIAQDNGMGMDEANMEHVFSPFFRVNESYNTSTLSLFTIKKSIEFLNGDINVTSSLGNGALFKLKIPVS